MKWKCGEFTLNDKVHLSNNYFILPIFVSDFHFKISICIDYIYRS